MRIAVCHPFGNELCDARAFFDPDCGRRPEVFYFDRFAKHGHCIWRQREQTVDRIFDFGVTEHVHQLDCLLHLRIKIILSERQLGGRERRRFIRWNVVWVHENRTVRITTDFH